MSDQLPPQEPLIIEEAGPLPRQEPLVIEEPQVEIPPSSGRRTTGQLSVPGSGGERAAQNHRTPLPGEGVLYSPGHLDPEDAVQVAVGSEETASGDPDPGGVDLDQRIVLGLAAGLKYPQVAKLANCSARTVQRRMESPEFRRRVRAAQEEMDEEIYGRALASSTAAMDTIDDAMKPEEAMGNRLAGARLALSTARDARTQRQLSERIEQLELIVEDLVLLLEELEKP